MEELKQGFIEEALQLVEKLEERLIEIENRQVEDADIQEIFRIMHTIKGSSAMFAFNNTEKITHATEDIYDLIRDKKLEFSPAIITLTIKANDLTKVLLSNNDQLDEGSSTTYNEVLSEIGRILPDTSDDELEPNSEEELISNQGSKEKESKIFYIFFKPDEDILQRGIAPISVFEELEEFGQITGFPFIEDVPLPENYDTSRFYLAWDIFIKTNDSQEDIEDCFLFYLDNEYKVIEIDPPKIEENAEFKSTCICLNRGTKNISQVKEKLSILTGEEFTETITEKLPKSVNEDKKIDSIKVDSKKLDDLINLVSELVTLNSRMELLSDVIEHEELKKTVKSVSKLSKKFRDNALELRLIPVKVLVLKMQRLIRDLSLNLRKDIEFITEGTNTELDKNIIAKLEGPLMHILRNSIDHGIEPAEERKAENKPEKGVIRFIAFYSGSNVYIQIQDDGRGIDVEAVKSKALEKGIITPNEELSKTDIFNLLFAPGFSTADSVSTVSGRGVGLDVVKKEITEMRGEIDIESEKTLGTSFTLKLPLTLSIIDTLMVQVQNTRILIPREYIVHTNILDRKGKKQIDKVEFEDKVIPVISLREDFSTSEEVPEKENNVIISQYDKFYAITVDRIIGEHQAVVKPLGYLNQNHDYFSGASILGDGSLAFILDINKVISIKRSKSNVGNYNLK